MNALMCKPKCRPHETCVSLSYAITSGANRHEPPVAQGHDPYPDPNRYVCIDESQTQLPTAVKANHVHNPPKKDHVGMVQQACKALKCCE